jgi:glycosyltransferase involved in cell wall biosynthesis
MRIAVNTRFLLKDRLEGIGRFTAEILQRICPAHPEHEFVFLFDRRYAEEFLYSANITTRVLAPQARHPILWKMWFERSVPRELERLHADLFFSPDGFCSLRSEKKTLLVIHDLAFEHYPATVPPRALNFYQKYAPRYAERADHIIAVSEFTKNDIVERYGVPPAKITVVHNGVSDLFKPLDEPQRQQVRKRYAAGKPYFLFVSALQPRKNLLRLLEAYDRFRERTGQKVKLLVAGAHTWAKDEINNKVKSLKHAGDVTFLGHLSQQELADVTASALALAYVSLFEGFGIPIAEALYTETPVICSNTSAMPVVAGDAALLIDPVSVEGISIALERIAADEGLRAELITKGRRQRTKFNWDQSARQISGIMEKMGR